MFRHGWTTPRLFEGEASRVRPPPGLKSFLFSLNLQVDWLLGKIKEIEWAGDPILWAEGTTEIERLTLLLEDRRYYTHAGFDWRCLPRMVRQGLTFKRLGGTSTIEQQLVRTILGRRERTVRRKSREILLAWILTHRKTKREVLRAYISTAYLGYRLRGVDDAARLLFAKDAAELVVEEAAFVASLLVYPLPKIVRLQAETRSLQPLQNWNSYWDFARQIAPRWARRVRRRMIYGVALRGKAK
jgi:hypothetical protein